MIAKLMLVDDESYIRKGLRKLVETHLPQWTCVGEAGNGEEAIALIERQMPDLILTDIRMPLCDGIRLAEIAHVRKWPARVIILTGYRDFEYAQAALRYGVLDFLLKPCPEEKVLDILERAYEAIREERNRERTERARREEEAIRARFLKLPAPAVPGGESGFPDACAGKTLVFLRVKHYFSEHKRFSERDLPLVQFALMNVVKELMDDYRAGGMLIPLGDHLFALLLQPGSAEEEKAFVQQAGRELERLLGVEAEWLPSGVIGPQDALHARLPLPSAPLREGETEGDEAERDGERIDSLRLKSREMERQLLHRIEAGQTEAWTEIVAAWVRELDAADVRQARMETLAIAASLHFVAKRVLGGQPQAETLWQQTRELGALGSAAEVKRWAEELAERFVGLIKEHFERTSRNAVAQAKAYIERRCGEPISLGEVAASVFLNANYFSWLFRKETGYSFVHYVTKIRMERAVALLMNTDMKVAEIAAEIGYDDPNYFTTVFRKTYQESPLQYRKQRRRPDI